MEPLLLIIQENASQTTSPQNRVCAKMVRSGHYRPDHAKMAHTMSPLVNVGVQMVQHLNLQEEGVEGVGMEVVVEEVGVGVVVGASAPRLGRRRWDPACSPMGPRGHSNGTRRAPRWDSEGTPMGAPPRASR